MTQLWWHAYGHVVPDGFPMAGSFYLAIAGESDRAPDEIVRQITLGPSSAPYLGSWDHEPTEADKRFITPADHRDERPAPAPPAPEVD